MEKIFIIMDKVYIEDKEGNIGVIIGDIHISRNSEGTPKNEEKFVNWLDIQNDLIQYLLNETHISDEIRLLPYYNKNDNNTIDYIYNDKIIFSGGKIGYQIETTLSELNKAISFILGDISE